VTVELVGVIFQFHVESTLIYSTTARPQTTLTFHKVLRRHISGEVVGLIRAGGAVG